MNLDKIKLTNDTYEVMIKVLINSKTENTND